MISKEQVRHIAQLARIELTEQELERYQKELSAVLEYFEVLQKADTSSQEPMTHSVVHENVSSSDSPRKENPAVVQRLLSLAPSVKEGFLKVRALFPGL